LKGPGLKYLYIGLIYLTAITSVHGQFSHVDIEEFVGQTQRTLPDTDKLSLIWWIPVEYWKIVLESDASVRQEEKEEMYRILSQYEIIAIADGILGPFGNPRFATENELIKSLRVTCEGKTYKPIMDVQTEHKEMGYLLNVLKPVISNMIGAVGEGMHFFVFKAHDERGKRIFDPTGENDFVVSYDEEDVLVKLPLSSLLEKIPCPEDGEMLSGDFLYCPYHGNKLTK
jgi:hypothetical protein